MCGLRCCFHFFLVSGRGGVQELVDVRARDGFVVRPPEHQSSRTCACCVTDFGLIVRMVPVAKPEGWARGDDFIRDMVCRHHGVVDRDANSSVLLQLDAECRALTGAPHPYTEDSYEEAIRRRLFGSCLPRTSQEDLAREALAQERTPRVLTPASGEEARARFDAANGFDGVVAPNAEQWARALRLLAQRGDQE